jgi:CRP-like cAMP-binding protein
MGIENERLRLVPHRLVATSGQTSMLYIEKQNGERVPLPPQFDAYFRAVSGGASLERLGLEARAISARGRFAKIAQFFSFLGDAGLLAEVKAVQMAEALRPDYRWRQSFAFDEIASINIFTLPGGATVFPWLWGALGFVAGVGVFALMLANLTLDFAPLGEAPISTAPMLAFIFTFFCARSIRAVMQTLIIRLTSGSAAALKLKMDLVSVSMATTDLSRAKPGWELLVGGFGCLLMSAFPGAALFLVPLQARPLVSYFALIVLLADFSPLVRSPLTEWLRALYNYLERHHRNRAEDRITDFISKTHTSLNVIWVAMLALVLAIPSIDLVRFFRSGPEFSDRVAQGLTYALAAPLLLIAIAFVDDLISAVSYIDAGGRSSVRRLARKMWRRSQATLPVDEAISQGKSPSRADLEKLPLIRQLDARTRGELLTQARVAEFHEGAAVCRQGDRGRSLFIVLSGRLAVAKSSESRRRRVVAFLEPGAVFGEAAFFFGSPRTADVVALEASRVLEIKHDPHLQTLDEKRSEELQLRIWFLQSLVAGSFLKHLPSEALDAVVFAGEKAKFISGQIVMREGERGDACYFLIQGQASVSQKSQLINKMKAGDAFGEIALLYPGAPRSATVSADSDLLCVRLEADSFWRLLARHLPLAVEIERLAESRLAADRLRANPN